MTDPGCAVIDSHAHLDDDQFAGEVDDVIERAAAAGVCAIVNVGYRPDRWRTTMQLVDRYSMIECTFGLHPHHAGEWSPSVETELIRLLRDRRPVALGEIGLDYYRNINPPDIQRGVFLRQLEIAEEFALPVVIHQRQAELDLMHILGDLPADVVCILHSFEGSRALAQLALERGHYIGVGGLMTRAGSTELRSVLELVPLDRVLVETDAPYLVPAGIKNRRNEPANVTRVVERLAELHGVRREDIAEATRLNSERVFGDRLARWTDQSTRFGADR